MPGDRKSICRARMKPVGLSFKDYQQNPFTDRWSGELMIIHLCLSCGKVSPNRIAGDDMEHKILELLEEANLEGETNQRLLRLGIKLLTIENKEEVLNNLFGYR